MATDTDTDFRASELVSSAGSGSNGEKLVGILLDFYPPELQAAQLKRINAELDATIDEDFTANVAKLVGVDRIEHVHVRGGDRRREDAVITYAYLDDRGEVVKGCFPYADLAKGKSDGHVNQRQSLSRSSVAQAHIAEHPRSARSGQAQPSADPFALAEMSAEELIALMDEHPERAEFIKSFEKAAHGSKARKTVMDHKVAGDEDSGASNAS